MTVLPPFWLSEANASWTLVIWEGARDALADNTLVNEPDKLGENLRCGLGHLGGGLQAGGLCCLGAVLGGQGNHPATGLEEFVVPRFHRRRLSHPEWRLRPDTWLSQALSL